MDLIIFDLDGTLVDSMSYWRNLTIDFLGARNLKISTEVLHFLNTYNLKLSIGFLKDYYKLRESFDQLYSEFDNRIIDFYSNKVKLKDGALEILKYFKERGLKIVLGTSTNEEYARIPLEKFGLKKYVEDINTVENIGTTKNKAEFFHILCKKYGILEKSSYLVDDSFIALRSAKEAGLVTIGIYDENSKDTWEDIKRENPHSIKNLLDLKNIWNYFTFSLLEP